MSKFIFALLIGLSACRRDRDTVFTELGVVRIDVKAKRLFIVKAESWASDVEKLKEHLSFVTDAVLRNQPDWNNSWNASYFSEERFVGYKDEPHIQQPLYSDEWRKGYLIEYSSKKKLITLFPLVPEKYRQVRLE